MSYCQDCGATNDTAATFCRICGRGLSAERVSEPCPSCRSPLANQAAFCSSCGIAITQTHATAPATSFAFAAGGSDVGNTATQILTPPNPAVQEISESLELPDWLKRAAAEQPVDSSQTTDASFMYTGINPISARPPSPTPLTPPAPTAPVQPNPFASFSVSEPPAEWPASNSPELQVATSQSIQPPSVAAPSSESTPASRRLLQQEIPSGGLERAMPTWLSEPPQSTAASAAPEPPPLPAPVAPPLPAATDTSSFISESDLPAWIRQLAEADEAKKAEEASTAVVAAAEQAATAASTDAGQNLFGERSLTRRISQLPGEAEPPAVVSNPWLSRHEQPEPASAAQADLWSKPMSNVPRDRAESASQILAAAESASSVMPEAAQSSPLSPVVNKVTSSSLLLWVLVAAVAVSVIAIAAYLFLLGGS